VKIVLKKIVMDFLNGSFNIRENTRQPKEYWTRKMLIDIMMSRETTEEDLSA
jgi:hypothetical protein